MELRNCPICDSRQIKRIEDKIERKIHQKVIRIPRVTFGACENCGERIFFPNSLKQMRVHAEEQVESECIALVR